MNWGRAAGILALGAAVVGLSLCTARSPIGVALGGEAQLTWTAPTKRCDGTPLVNLAGYALTYGQGAASLPLAPLTYTVRGLAPGDWWFGLAAVDATGERSDFITVTKTVTPAEFKTVATTAYTLVKQTDALLLLPVGTVALGVPCVAGHTVNGYYVVPYLSVTFSGGARPKVVFASCG